MRAFVFSHRAQDIDWPHARGEEERPFNVLLAVITDERKAIIVRTKAASLPEL